MNPSRPFIERPVATSLVMVAIVFAGALGYGLLPQAALPQVDYPTIQVVTFQPGASADVMTTTVTAPLERQLGAMAGLVEMTSASSAGASVITLQFALELSLDVAEQNVQAAINAAAAFLPRDLPAPPVYNKVNPADAPVLTFAVSSDVLPLTEVHDLLDTHVAPKLAQVPGVGLVSLGGGQRPALRIRANPAALASYGLSLGSLGAAIAAGSSQQAKGSFDGPEVASALEANTQLRTVPEHRDLVIAERNGAPVRLGDVADVSMGPEDARVGAWANGRPAILVSVQRQPGANVIRVVDAIRALLPELEAALPASVSLEVLTDRTLTIRASVRDVQLELALAVVLVVAVIFVFLRSGRATLIPSLAVPLSIVGTFALMHAFGFSLNNLTLMALTIASGFVVDDAIVMIENIARHLEGGKRPLQAALDGAREIGFTIVSLTFSLVAVLIPLVFMGDVVGRLFREFAITLAAAILISAVVSLTFTPMLSARLLRHEPGREEGAAAGAFRRVVDRYAVWLRRVLDRPVLALAVAGATLALTVALVVTVPKGFFPVQDTGVLQGVILGPEDASYAAMAARGERVAGVLLADSDVRSASTVVGVDGVNPTVHQARLLVELAPAERRRASAQEVARRLVRALGEAGDPDTQVTLQPVQDLTIDDRLGRTPYQLQVTTTDAGALPPAVERIVDRVAELPDVRDVGSDLAPGGRAWAVEIDRDRAARLGVTVAAIDAALGGAFGQRFLSTIFTQTNQYRVVLEADAGTRRGRAVLDALYVAGRDGRPVPLASVAHVRPTAAGLVVHRDKQLPAAAVSFDLAPGRALGDAVAAIHAAVASLGLPASVETRFAGAASAFSAALRNELALVLAALVTMYIVLGVLYESFVHPLTILSTLPSAGVGALLALRVTGNELTVVAIIGIVLLIGIVQKNAILIIDFALAAERTGGKAPADAVFEACVMRFRPILMTTLAALFSAIPLVAGTGPGAELRRPLGITMIGGLLVSQVLTLFTTPVVYLTFDRLARLARGRKASARRRAVALTTEEAA